jgi:hypothetical protein
MTVDLLKARVSSVAIRLMNRDRYSYMFYSKYAADGPKRPQQHGLAYSYGSRDHTKREAPKEGVCMDKEIYGLDCSGFIYRCFFHSGVTDPALKWRAEEQRQVERLKNAILKAYPELTGLKVEDLGPHPLALMKPGDIIYWLREDNTAYHIGWIFETEEGEIMVAQSNGEGTNPATCDQNYGPSRGPRVFGLEDAIKPRPYSLGDKYSIVRISSEAPEPNFITCYVAIRVHEYWHKTEGGIERDFELNNLRRYSYDYYTGSFEGNTFTGNLLKTVDNLSFSGSIIAILNATHDNILYLKWNETMLNSSTNCETTESLILKNIPYANVPMTGASTFEVKGKTSCDHISSLTADSKCPDSESLLLHHQCNSDSEISIIFSTW